MEGVITSPGILVGETNLNIKVGVTVGVAEGMFVGRGVKEGVSVVVYNAAVRVAAAPDVIATMVSTPPGTEVGIGLTSVEISQLTTKIVAISRKYTIRF